MNSIQQEYLDAMGIDIYRPRWSLPFAAESPEYFVVEEQLLVEPLQEIEKGAYQPEVLQTNNILQNVLSNIETRANISEVKVSKVQAPQEEEFQVTISPFSLNLWRPSKSFLVIADHTTDALPTELLMQNILRFYTGNYSLKIEEDVLRWPAVQTSQLGLTEENARTELQTWLSVQHEFEPIKQLYFFGDSWRFFVQEQSPYNSDFFSIVVEAAGNLTAKCFPSLRKTLQSPLLKANVLELM